VKDSSWQTLTRKDKEHIWHPYASAHADTEVFPVVAANGVRLELADGRTLIDGMASWWCAIHGYNHPVLNQAATDQLAKMSHVMFGGLTHPPAVELAELLCKLTPPSLNRVFFSDSGSVSVEVSLKMAIQYWQASNRAEKQKIVALRNGYHGDTFGAMSVCDPVTGMHHLFGDSLTQQIFAPQPECGFAQGCSDADIRPMRDILSTQHAQIAAIIVEPVVQGAGGMHFYSPEYLIKLRALCDEFEVLLIFDEIATGFGRTGKLFALEHAQVEPDILCLGKALTGGYLTLAATLCNSRISEAISNSEAAAFMHGPTFMANPLACAIAHASVSLLISEPWQDQVARIEKTLEAGLDPARELPQVKNVRTLGAIGVIELHDAVDMRDIQAQFVAAGVWVRPFGKLVYAMPPYIMSDGDIATLTNAMVNVVGNISRQEA